MRRTLPLPSVTARAPVDLAPSDPRPCRPELLVEADPVHLEWVAATIRASRRLARAQLYAELVICLMVLLFVVLPCAVRAITS